MKKSLCCIALILVLSPSFFSLWAFAYNGSVLVYVTNTGECYHRDGCTYLKSHIEITLEQAVNRNYRACSRCHPPTLGVDSEYDSYTYSEYKNRNNSNSSSKSSGSNSSFAIAPQEVSPSVGTRSSSASESTLVKGISNSLFWALVILVGLPLLLIFAGIVMGVADWAKDRKLIPEYRRLYANHTKTEIAIMCGMPESSSIGKDGLPHEKYKQHDKYFVYASPKGRCYHRTKTCTGGKLELCHIMLIRDKEPCARCHPLRFSFEWYGKYQKIISDMDRFKIPYQN